MVTLVARQSVILKCSMQASVMLGNYEFYYGAGLFCRLAEVDVKEEIHPQELHELLLPRLKDFTGKDEKERYLVKMLLAYQPEPEYDAQMKELLMWGLGEKKIWKAD